MQALSSSFRDPSGFVFERSGAVYRQINLAYRETYDELVASGLLESLVSSGKLIPHEEVSIDHAVSPDIAYKILKPVQVPYISYPYEWSFNQLKAAAMLTLRIQSAAMKKGFVLKDASAFNVQFIGCKPVFIDTLSFDIYNEGEPWQAYQQFCKHFLAPLALASYRDIDLMKLSSLDVDGTPLTLASTLLPKRTFLHYGLASHIHLHARMQERFGDADGAPSGPQKSTLSKPRMLALLESLAKTVDGLTWKLPKSEWGDYYNSTNYSDEAASHKRTLVDDYLSRIPDELNVVHDLGGNIGEFSCIAAKYAKLVVSQDIDPVAVERNFLLRKADGPSNVLPLVQSLTNPAPAIGWANAERLSFTERAHCDGILALALVHHLAISNNVPLLNIARLFSSLAPWLVIEFVPKSDSQVRRLLATREDIFPDYTKDGFERAFLQQYTIEASTNVTGSERTLYLMKSRREERESLSSG